MLQLKLVTWFQKNARTLPWRSNPTPYYVWISEIMLQQTQVATVLPYFDRFIKKFPTVETLAAAHLDEVYQLWAGLGYYSRARNLHQGAKKIVTDFLQTQGRFPNSRDEWLSISGVGEYTAGAICSIALNQHEPIVDGNVVRVLSRIFAIAKLDSKRSEIWAQAKKLVSTEKVSPRDLNQSLMELGALICKPKNPLCGECPVRTNCRGKTDLEKYPPPKPKKNVYQVKESKWILLQKSGKNASQKIKVLLSQNQGTKWRAGLWDFPDAGSIKSITKKMSTRSAELLSEFMIQYVVTNHKISRKHQVFLVKEKNYFQISKIEKLQWFDVHDLPAVPAPVRKAVLRVMKECKREEQ